MAATDFVSDKQFARANAEPDLESPPRPTVTHAEKFNADQFQGFVGAQFAGLVGPDEAEAPKARRANYIAGQSVHEYRTSPGSSQ